FFFHASSTSYIFTLSLHDALPIFFWVAVFVATGFLAQAEPGDRRTSMSLQKQHVGTPIRILDQNGQPAANGVRSASGTIVDVTRSEEHTSELQSRSDLVCRLLLEK